MSGAVRRELVGAKRHGGDVFSRIFDYWNSVLELAGLRAGRRIVWVRAKRASADDAEGAEKDVRKGSLLVVEGGTPRETRVDGATRRR